MLMNMMKLADMKLMEEMEKKLLKVSLKSWIILITFLLLQKGIKRNKWKKEGEKKGKEGKKKVVVNWSDGEFVGGLLYAILTNIFKFYISLFYNNKYFFYGN